MGFGMSADSVFRRDAQDSGSYAPLPTQWRMNFEPKAVAEAALRRRMEVQPQLSFGKLGLPFGLETMWAACVVLSCPGGHLT